MLLRATTWAALAAIAVLSLLPGEEMVRSGLGGRVEHVVAYAGTALLAALAFSSRWNGLRIGLALIAYAAALEYLQRFSPGRSPSVLDFMFSSLGVVIGVSAFAALAQLRTKWTSPTKGRVDQD